MEGWLSTLPDRPSKVFAWSVWAFLIGSRRGTVQVPGADDLIDVRLHVEAQASDSDHRSWVLLRVRFDLGGSSARNNFFGFG